MASVLAKEAVKSWISLLNNKERYYYAKAMDVFFSMKLEDQRSLLRFFSEETSNKDWQDKIDDGEDSTQYSSVIRGILFYYSGNAELKEPTKDEFKSLLGKWIRIHEKAKAKVLSKKEKEDFSKELEGI